MHTLLAVNLVGIALFCIGCGGKIERVTPDTSKQNPELTGDFMHPSGLGANASADLSVALRRAKEEGPATYSARVHSCTKVKYPSVGRMLASRGVNLNANDQTNAGRMWRDASQALGAANLGGRISETTEPTVAIDSRLFDIYSQAAAEMLQSLEQSTACPGTKLFDDAGKCLADGISCVTGTQASQAQVDLCNVMVARAKPSATDPDLAKKLAIATILAAAHTCE